MTPALPPLPAFLPGWVWLCGAGPGDPGLLTLHGLNALAQADTVVYDALVSEAVLALARPGACLQYAGKRGGKPSARQADISLEIVERARQGQRVLRLKGGDPFVFGRGGEEALALTKAGIPFRIIPGISAGIGGLAYAGIPVTHREVNSAVTFLTGHDSSGATPNAIDWEAVARGAPVLVFYMALKHLPEIVRRLLAAGRGAEEPLAIVAQASLPGQRVLETTLGQAVAAVAEAGIEPPALVVLGEVVRLRAALSWLDRIPSTAAQE
jgi:uroporphyrin-III C-methyltransferase